MIRASWIPTDSRRNFVFTIWLGLGRMQCNWMCVLCVCPSEAFMSRHFFFGLPPLVTATPTEPFWLGKNMQTILVYAYVVRKHTTPPFRCWKCVSTNITNCENGNMKCCTYIKSYTNTIQCDRLWFGDNVWKCICFLCEHLSYTHFDYTAVGVRRQESGRFFVRIHFVSFCARNLFLFGFWHSKWYTLEGYARKNTHTSCPIPNVKENIWKENQVIDARTHANEHNAHAHEL